MVVDSSAIIAILRAEPGYEAFSTKLLSSHTNRISTATYLELCLVYAGDRGESELWQNGRTS
jgi:uncharacterized protein with PIN domain